MVQKVLSLQGVAVTITIYDRLAGEATFEVDGERWCSMPGLRYLMLIDYDLGDGPCVGYQYYDDRLAEFQVYRGINRYFRKRLGIGRN